MEKQQDQSSIPAAAQPPLPIEDDIMQLARLGQIGAIQKLFNSGKFDINYKDEQGITPLHVRRKQETVSRVEDMN